LSVVVSFALQADLSLTEVTTETDDGLLTSLKLNVLVIDIERFAIAKDAMMIPSPPQLPRRDRHHDKNKQLSETSRK
jgi:hypothetical protein